MVDASASFVRLTSLVATSRNLPFDMDKQVWGSSPSQEPLDGALIFNLALHHKVIRDVYRNLDIIDDVHFSVQVRAALQRAYLLEQSAKQMLSRQWRLLSPILSGHGVRCMVVKGPASSLQLYGDANARGFTDLDILVDAPDLSMVVPLVEQAGYRLKTAEVQPLPPATWSKNLIQRTHHLVFVSAVSPFRLEVHNELFEYSVDEGMESSALFDRHETLLWDTVALPTLSLVDHALFILDHGTHHGWIVLHWLVDVAALLDRDDPDFHRALATKLVETGRVKQFALAWRLCRSLFPVELPQAYEAIIAGCRAKLRYQMAFSQRQLASEGGSASSFGSIMRFTYCYRLPLARSSRERSSIATQLWKIAPQDLADLPLPAWLLPLHLLLRPFLVIRRRISRAVAARRATP
jgi:hypothetical protein